MQFDKLTIKSQQVIQDAQSLALRKNNQAIEPLHILKAMLDDKEGITVSIVKKLGGVPEQFSREVASAMDRLVQVTGAGDIYLSKDTKMVVDRAFVEADKMKDQYVSIEHLLMGLTHVPGPHQEILKHNGVSRDVILKVLRDIRGNQTITDQNPEEKYQALEKFGRNLTELARTGKLDPVIGRDEEIRRIVQVLSRRRKKQSCAYR